MCKIPPLTNLEIKPSSNFVVEYKSVSSLRRDIFLGKLSSFFKVLRTSPLINFKLIDYF